MSPVLHQSMTDAAARLRDAVRAVAPAGERRIVRLSVPASPVDPSAWLCCQRDDVRVFWSGKDERRIMAGVGAVDWIRGDGAATPAEVIARGLRDLPDHPDARVYGGFAFQPGAAVDADWRAFGPSCFWIPRVELVRDDNGTRLACNVLIDEAAPGDPAAALEALDRLREPDPACVQSPPVITGRINHPDREQWAVMVNAALELIGNETLEKIVLARRADYQFGSAVDAATLQHRIRAVTSNCYHFLLQPGPGSAFMGTTPERLFRRTGTRLQSEVLAGTRTRGSSQDEDLAYARELLGSEKDQREHDIVRKSIRQRLHLLCSSLQVDEQANLLRLERKQHLHSKVAGELKPGVGDADLISALHPTPAVGGYPSDIAVHEIQRLEPFRRGWYAAPVGWVSRTGAEFAVAIRSGLVHGNTVSVYSGAGIVSGSVPAEEWEEIEAKIGDFQKVVRPA